MNFSTKAKGLSFNSAGVRYLVGFILLICAAVTSYGQVESGVKPPEGILPIKADTSNINPDSIIVAVDTVQRSNDSTVAKRPQPKGDITTTINYSARDSIRASMDGKKIWLYGAARIKYGEIELEAEEIEIDYENSTLTANGIRDSLGNRIGFPIFKNGPELYETKDIVYNFKTKRARISEVVTQQGEAYIHGDVVYKNEKGELLSRRNSYTTCNLEHPHFVIRATKTKAIPNDKIVAGPFYLEFNDIPLPAGFLFGMFPSPRRSASGIIFPSYGEERRRGFNLRGGGYFFDINEYVKLALTGDIYSKGGHALYANSNYMKRYKYTGAVNVAYSKNPSFTDRIEDTDYTKDFRITWSHTPQSKGTGRFAASVNAATSTFNRNNFINNSQYNNANLNNITAKLSSNISYSKRFARSPFSLGVNLNHSQDLQTRAVDLLLPNISLNMTNIYPFQRKTGSGNGPLDNFSIAYTMNAQNRITNNIGRVPARAKQDSIAAFTGENLPLFLRNARKGIRHSIPASFSFKALRFFTMSPSFNYEEKWYGEKLLWGYNNDSSMLVKTDTIKGFNRISNYSTSVSLTTRIYGMYNFKNPASKVKAIRHIINPTISYNYTPNFAKNTDYFQEFEDRRGNIIYQDRYQGFVYGGSGRGNSSAIGFGLGNNVEMKVQGAQDSVARKVMLLNNLSINSSYNFIADTFKLAPIAISANTNILDNLLNINLSATLNPYRIERTATETGIIVERRVDQLAWRSGSLGRITNATLAMSTNLNPQKRNKNTTSREKIGKSNLPEHEKEFLLQNPDYYIDFEIPWSLAVSYSLAYSRGLNAPARVTQTVNFQGDVSLSEKWKVNYSSGYHFESGEFTMTNIGISRDLHCWTMSVQWTPFGRFQQFFFTINVKSSLLQDLKLERRKPFYDNL